MAYTPREIKDRVAVGDDIFIVQDLGNNRIRLIPAPTHVLEPGTPVNKALLQPIEDYLATGVVPVERRIIAGNGLSGGGSLDADRTLSVKFGTTAGTVCEGNDYRLSNARPPTAHNHDDRYYTKAQVDQKIGNFGESRKASSGYVWLPGGLLLQWGRTGHINADSSVTVNFPIPFPNRCFQVVATKLNSTSGNDHVFCVVRSFNNTSVTLKMEKINFAVTNYVDGRYATYFAIGY